MAEITIRSAETADVPEILRTLRAALGETPLLQRTKALWEWKHVNNPFGQSLVLVAETEGRIAGVRAMMRWRLVTREGGSLKCLRPVDTATHPDFARRGIFKELTMTALQEARSQDIDLVFNTPNEQSEPGYLEMGWKRVSRIGVLVRPRLGPTAKTPPDSPPRIESLASELLPGAQLPGDFPQRTPLGLRTPRGPDYLAWRFGAHPTAEYGWTGTKDRTGLVARASTRGGRTELVVSDLLGQPGSSLVRLASRQSRARYMAGWFSPGSPERRIAIRGGMLPIPGLKPLRLVALPLTDFDIDVFDIGSWDLATSDLELL